MATNYLTGGGDPQLPKVRATPGVPQPPITRMGGGGNMPNAGAPNTGTINVPGVGDIDVGSLMQQVQALQAQYQKLFNKGAGNYNQATQLANSMPTSVRNGQFARNQAVAAQGLRTAQQNLAGRFQGDTSSPAYAMAAANMGAQAAAPAAAQLAELEQGNLAAKQGALTSLASMGLGMGSQGNNAGAGMVGSLLQYGLGMGQLANDRYGLENNYTLGLGNLDLGRLHEKNTNDYNNRNLDVQQSMQKEALDAAWNSRLMDALPYLHLQGLDNLGYDKLFGYSWRKNGGIY